MHCSFLFYVYFFCSNINLSTLNINPISKKFVLGKKKRPLHVRRLEAAEQEWDSDFSELDREAEKELIALTRDPEPDPDPDLTEALRRIRLQKGPEFSYKSPLQRKKEGSTELAYEFIFEDGESPMSNEETMRLSLAMNAIRCSNKELKKRGLTWLRDQQLLNSLVPLDQRECECPSTTSTVIPEAMACKNCKKYQLPVMSASSTKIQGQAFIRVNTLGSKLRRPWIVGITGTNSAPTMGPDGRTLTGN